MRFAQYEVGFRGVIDAEPVCETDNVGAGVMMDLEFAITDLNGWQAGMLKAWSLAHPRIDPLEGEGD